jgi:hypothetical protein
MPVETISTNTAIAGKYFTPKHQFKAYATNTPNRIVPGIFFVDPCLVKSIRSRHILCALRSTRPIEMALKAKASRSASR